MAINYTLYNFITQITKKKYVINENVFIDDAHIGDILVKLPILNKSKITKIFSVSKLDLYNEFLFLKKDIISKKGLIINSIKNTITQEGYKKVIISPLSGKKKILLGLLLGDEVFYYNREYEEKTKCKIINNKRIKIIKSQRKNKFENVIDLTNKFLISSNMLKKPINRPQHFYNFFKNIKHKKVKIVDEDYITVVNLGSDPLRRYNKYKEVIEKLRSKITIVYIEEGGIKIIRDKQETKYSKKPIGTLFGIILNSIGVIGNETGLTHYGYLSGKPTIEIVGGGRFGWFVPDQRFKNLYIITKKMECFYCDWKCKYTINQTYPCISKIKPNQVVNIALKVFKL